MPLDFFRDPPTLRAHNRTNLFLKLPGGKKIKDIKWLAVWCRRFTVSTAGGCGGAGYPAPPCPAVPRIKTSRPGVTVPPAAGFRPGDIRIRLAGAQGAEIIIQRSRPAGEGLGTGSVRQWVMPPCNKVKCFLKPT